MFSLVTLFLFPFLFAIAGLLHAAVIVLAVTPAALEGSVCDAIGYTMLFIRD